MNPRTYTLFLAILAVLAFRLGAEVVDVKVAILSSHEPRDLGYYIELRKGLYEAWSLRALRFLERQTRLALDEGHWFRSVASFLLIMSSSLIFVGFFKRRWRRWFYYTATCFLLSFGFWIYLFSGVASLNQADMKGGHRVQDVLDVTTAWGLDSEVFWDWNEFTASWNEEDKQPHVVVAWMGLPLGAEELEIESWLSKHRHLSMLHICIGANLPKMFHRPLFGDSVPKLDWSPDGPKSVTDPKSAYGRDVNWQAPDSHSTSARLVPWDKHWILYLPKSVPPDSMARLMEKGLQSFDDIIWGRLDLSKVIALRLDDPGSSINLHLEPWHFPTLSPERWKGIAEELQELDASMTVGVCPGWVDDGDLSRGKLYVDGQLVEQREPGTVYPTHLVRFEPADGSPPWHYDLQAEVLKSQPVFDLQSHGHTHISPDLQRWAKSDRRYVDYDWYREFLVTEDRPFSQRPAEVQKKILNQAIESFKNMTGKTPSILIPPGHAISWNTADLVFQAGFKAMAGRHLVLKKGENELRRTRLIPAVDINELEKIPSTPYPAMVLLHDKDFAESQKSLEESLQPIIEEGGANFVSVATLVNQIYSSPSLKIDRVKNLLHFDWPGSEKQVSNTTNQTQPIQFKVHLPNHLKVDWGNLENMPGYLSHEAKGTTYIISYRLHSDKRSIALPFER